jgi:hypothetical protein
MNNHAIWLHTSLARLFPSTPAPAEGGERLDLHLARGEHISFQACARNLGTDKLNARVEAAGSDMLAVTVRRVGYVPVAHHNTQTPEDELDGLDCLPGLAPDPLFPQAAAVLGPRETQAFWITVAVPAGAPAGRHEVRVAFTLDGQAQPPLTAALEVSPLVAQPRRDFPMTHWFYADALCDWYKVEPFEERFWDIAGRYMADLVAHGNDCQYVPIFTPPTDGVKRPTQLLKVSEPAPGMYFFEFGDVRRWVKLAQSHGARWFEWTHLFTQWGAGSALRIYRRNSDPRSLLWGPETEATSPTYRNFLSQFLPQFKAFLLHEGLMDQSIFHLSDEPGAEHLDNYRRARAMLKELAPWMRVSDALSHVEFGQQGLTDNPIPSISSARDYAAAGIPAWTYFCCGPRGRYLNRLIDTPLPKMRMAGWLFYKLGARGFLHWGYNYWYKSQTQRLIDPFAEQAAEAWPGWAYGDPFVVYPGTDGPIDSLRWEVWAESLQDYALLQSAGIAPDDPLLADIKDYDDYPKTQAWIERARRTILASVPSPATSDQRPTTSDQPPATNDQ